MTGHAMQVIAALAKHKPDPDQAKREAAAIVAQSKVTVID